MFRVLAVGVIAVGVYLLDDAASNNTRAKRKYKKTVKNSQKRVGNHYANAQRKDTLDKLFKIKKAKIKIADEFYISWKNEQKNFNQINKEIKASKVQLNNFFNEKKLTESREEKRAIQEHISLLQLSRKELFKIKDMIQANKRELKLKLDQANAQTRKIQDEINLV